MFDKLVTRFRRGTRVGEPTKLETDAITAVDDDEHSHEWDRPLEFIFSLISNSVGLGNVWRFPYLAAKNGGGAFLIPYFVLYFLIGAPLYYLELALGQFTSRGPAKAFIIAKGWQGIGIAMIINSVLCMLYYNVIISWALFYFISSFRSNLLWKKCGNWWNDYKCFVPGPETSPFVLDDVMFNCTKPQYENRTMYSCVPIKSTERATATQQFYFKLLLGKSEKFEDFGRPQAFGALSLLISWIIVGLCIIRGVKSSGKVAYFTAIFPYIVLLILIIQSATLSGAVEGVKFYVIPKWHLVGKFETWQAAASQVFFSLGLSFGSLMAYSSSNKFHNNFFRQMCIVVLCDCFTGIFAGFAVFSTLGFLANQVKETVAKYAESSGPGLAFITYPEAISRMPASPFFSILFFLMLLALGLGSQFALTDVPITSIVELFPKLQSKRPLAVVITCIASFLISLPFTCPGGIYLLELFMEYAANISLIVVGFFEVYVIAYIYGFNRFMNDVKMMLGKRAAQYYLFLTWCIASPILILIITLTKLINSAPMKNAAGAGYEEYTYPNWSQILGWFIFVLCIIPIPLVYVVNYIKEFRELGLRRSQNSNKKEDKDTPPEERDYSEKPRFLAAITENNTPGADWGPKKKANQYGPYTHLRTVKSNNVMKMDDMRSSSNNEYTNQNYQSDNISDTDDFNVQQQRF